MGKLLKFEFRRLFQMASFYIFIGLIAVVNFMFISSQGIAYRNNMTITRADIFSDVFQSTFVVLLFAIFIPIYVCRNFSEGTIKNICAKGYSRTQLFFTQLIVALVAAAAFCVVAVFTNVILCVIYIPETGDMKTAVLSVVLQSAVLIAYACIFLSLSCSLEKTGGAIAVNIVFYAMGGYVFLIIDSILYNYVTKGTSMRDFQLSNFWIGAIYDKCRYIQLSDNIVTTAIVFSVVYAAIFIAIGFFVSRKKEL